MSTLPEALHTARADGREFTTVVVCETGTLRTGESLEIGPVGVLLFRTSALPQWAHSISYDRGELHVAEDDGPGRIEELRQLIRRGDAMLVKNARFVHAAAPIGSQMVGMQSSYPTEG